jgi:hypothetical protein
MYPQKCYAFYNANVDRFPLHLFHAGNGPGELTVPQLVKNFRALCHKVVGFRRGVIEGYDLEI